MNKGGGFTIVPSAPIQQCTKATLQLTKGAVIQTTKQGESAVVTYIRLGSSFGYVKET